MKKITTTIAAVVLAMLCACSFDRKDDKPLTTEVSLRVLIPEDLIKEDHSYMKRYYGEEYRWHGCYILYHNYLDEGGGGAIEEVTNIFQVRSDTSNSHDVNMIIKKHTLDDDTTDSIKSLWVEEDVPMFLSDIQITHRQATIAARKEGELHTKHLVLRKQLGPMPANPQYIFGNNQGLVFVDAITGDVSHESPAFRNTGFATWLGEWPY